MTWQDDLIRGKQQHPPRICIYGAHAIGKSTLAASFPSPIFINTEEGLDALDVTSFPRADTGSLDGIKEAIGKLVKDDHPFTTAVIDTVDWLVEPYITKDVEANHSAQELSYGKGAVMIAEEFRSVLQGLDALRKRRGMNVVLVAHAEIKRYENPLTEPYDRFLPKLPPRCNALLQEWVDVLAFASFQIIVKKTEVGFNKDVRRGVSTGDRNLHLVETAGFVAKCRYPGAPKEIAMTVEALAKHVPVVGMTT